MVLPVPFDAIRRTFFCESMASDKLAIISSWDRQYEGYGKISLYVISIGIDSVLVEFLVCHYDRLIYCSILKFFPH